MTEEIIKNVESIIGPAYLVGGSVRDIILGRDPKDYDFTTPLLPDNIETKVRAAGRRPYLIGKKFGTIGFKVKAQERWHYVEVTTFRKEAYEPKNRKPVVEFVTDLKEDLSRRDFTINAIALHNGDFYDPFGGRIDILARKIKAVGSSKDRFKEDPLRMLRAARFSAQLDFSVDPNMIGQIRKMPEKILDISRERWVQELDKLLVSDNVASGFDVLMNTHLMKYTLPEVYILPVNLQNEITNKLYSAEHDPDIRWSIMLASIGKPFVETRVSKSGNITYPHHNLIAREISVGICARLRFSNDRTRYVLNHVEKYI